jgi:hypothetical protein
VPVSDPGADFGNLNFFKNHNNKKGKTFMSNSFEKEFVQLSGVGITSLFKQSAAGISAILKGTAKIIDTVAETAADLAEWPEFELVQYPDSTVLKFDLKDLDPSEYEVNYNSQFVRLNIRPYCQDYLIPNITRFFSYSGYSVEKRLKLSKFAKANQHLRWSTCTADELKTFFSEWIFRIEGESGGQFPWQSRAMDMLKPLIAGAIRMRDADFKISAALFKQHLPLDGYLTLLDNPFIDKQALMIYLDSLPAFHVEDYKTNNLSQRCYEQHGHLVMQIRELLATDQKSGIVRTERRPDRDITRNFLSKTIVSAEAVRVENRLEITVKHASKEFVRLNVQA